MTNDEFHKNAIGILVNAQKILEHSAVLTYAEDLESITTHLYWIKWYLQSFRGYLDVLSDVRELK